MEQKSKLQARCVEIVVHLISDAMAQIEAGLDLHDQRFIDDQVNSLTTQFLTFVEHDHRDFTPNPVTAGQQLTLESEKIDVLLETETERVVHLVECPNHRTRQLFMNQWSPLHRVTLSRER